MNSIPLTPGLVAALGDMVDPDPVGRIATDGHARACETCHVTIEAGTPYFRISGVGYCASCATAWASFMGLMAAWEARKSELAAEARKSERRLTARERSMRRKLYDEWREGLDLEG